MILSCSTITWGELKDGKQFGDALASIKALGYSDAGIEYPLLSASLKRSVAGSKGAALAKKAGLTVAAVAIDSSPEMASVVTSFGSKVGWLCLFEKDIDLAIEKTKKLADACARLGVSVSLHPHVRSNILTTEDLDRIIKACGPDRTTVCVDTAHLTALDIDVPKFINRYKKSISLVHFKDLRAKVPQEEVDYVKDFVDLGDGVADLKGSLKALRAIGYSGAIMVEVDNPPEGGVEASARKNYGYLKKIVGGPARAAPA
ncbi:MAG: sugar phosphate isomerase/epimerase family protein [Nitrososphaerales archaeon]